MSMTTCATEYAASEKLFGAAALISRPGPKWKGVAGMRLPSNLASRAMFFAMTTRLSEAVPSSSAVKPARCLNCDAPLTGIFCAECGQRDVPPYPSVRELAIDAVQEFSGWDGR